MKVTIKTLTILFIWLCVYSCNESPHINFHSYQELSEYTFIANGWIPEIVGKDAYNIQETYDTNNKHVFGKFDFKFHAYYDSIMQSYPSTENDTLLARIAEIRKPAYPKCFIPKEDLKKGNYVLAKQDNFYLIMQKTANRIYYLR